MCYLRGVPLPILFPVAFFLGLSHALLAERAASQPGAAGAGERLLWCASLFGALIVLPVHAYLLYGYHDWAYLYLLRGEHIPSALSLLLLLAAAALVPAGAWLGARWLAQDARYRVLRLSLALGVVALLTCVASWRRLTHVGTYAQYLGNFGLRSVAECALGPSVLLVMVTMVAGMIVSARLLRP